MTQPQPQPPQSEIIKEIVVLLKHGNPEDWNMHYRARQFEKAMIERAMDALILDFKYQDRKVLYQCVNDRFLRKCPVDYLEFGVAGGASFIEWLRINPHADSRFYGFDTFEGLPEDWQANSPKGAYSQGGRIPKVDDPRAVFLKGMFQETAGEFLKTFSPRNRLVIHCDADLYSSTLYVLMKLEKLIVPGTIIIFDEFTARSFTDEFAALQDFCASCLKDYKVLARRTDFAKIVIEII